MSDATLVATEIQDLASAVGDVVAAVRAIPAAQQSVVVNVPDPVPQPAAQVTVNVPEALPPSVVVNVPEAAAPQVHVAAAELTFSPQVLVAPSPPNAYEVRITERDAYGYIVSFTITPQ